MSEATKASRAMARYDIYIRVAGSVGDAPIQRVGVEAGNARAALELVVTDTLGSGLEITPSGNGWERTGELFQSTWAIGQVHSANVVCE